MHPILFTIPGLDWPIRSFGVMVVLGFILGSHAYAVLGQRYAKDPMREAPGFAAVPMWVLLGIMLGARAMYVIVEILRGSETGQAYLDDPLKIFAYWEGGLVMYGGAFGGIALGLWGARKHMMRLWHALDLGLVAGILGLSVGRIGCLLVGDDFGSRVPVEHQGLPFPITLHVPEVLPNGSLFGPENAGQVLWATQPWMTANALLLFVIGLFLMRRRRWEGQVAAQMLVLYAIGRYTIENFRGDSMRGLWFDGAISTSQLVSIVVASVCLVILFVNRKRDDRRNADGTRVDGQPVSPA
ncbi:MAG: prolipoprotein diacylglyceryl transferase [Planctomycetota bacterium]